MRRIGIHSLVLSLIMQVMICGAGLCSSETKGLEIKLLSEEKVVSSGATITLGLSIKHDEGFHTYWKNPGNVGMATGIKWELPEGFVAESIQWACPELCLMAGHPCHGYERDVLLMVKIKVPEKLQTNEVRLSANAAWMCCADDCYPGSKGLSITLPVGDEVEIDPSTADLFVKARKDLPLRDHPWEVELLSEKDADVISFKFRLKDNAKKGNLASVPEYLFSDDGQISSDKKQRFIKQGDGSYVLQVERSEFSPKLKTEFTGVFKAGKQFYFVCSSYRK